MPTRAELRPKGPYSLRLSGRLASDATRVVSGGTYRATFRVEDRLERVHAAQRVDGTIAITADSDAGVDHVRFALGLDDDHSEFVRRFAKDPLLGETLRRVRGLRPVRTGTVAQALLRAVAGQLIQAREARRIERRVIQRACPERDGLHAPPTDAELARFSPAELARLGLGARRASALIRLCRTVDLEGLKAKPSTAVALRLNRERGLGPWSVGVVCLEGLGRYEYGLARDLGLVKLAAALSGRWVEAEESDALLAPYGEWAGLASVYLLAGFNRGLVPLPRAAAA
ncbi:MAG: DNA-3-methyladenine glycosylase [Gaiellaceae bacterium]|jgi:3-methyladenine DNA glycosylase/8-oxoguanine DNA glycosylase|nr:DNA-3-methyladenine glycosylase [Gaiellaceae bacterium]